MKKYYSVSQAAEIVQTTGETLRHYDRIGLVKPSCRDEHTNYRYYSEQDIVRLNTVRALQRMDISLPAIKEVLEYEDLGRVVEFLNEAEKRADAKIAELQRSKEKIQRAKTDYQRKLREQKIIPESELRHFPERVILLSEDLNAPALENLWDYLKHFYNMLEAEQREQFEFEDCAGIYTPKGVSRLFTVCRRCGEADGLKILPAGRYLCALCNEEQREAKINELLYTARREYNARPEFIVEQIIVSGILSWNYQIQLYLPENGAV